MAESANPVPQDAVAATPAPIQRPNEAWWQEYGGQLWLEEIQRRRTDQRHYAQQEAFFYGFFQGIRPARVLDFGCGFGRHLRYLKSIDGSEFYGCDMSRKMLDAAADYIGDPDFARSRLVQIAPRGKLPFPDGFFDIVMTSEVLIHVDSLDLPAILRELWRVSRSLILHVENPPVEGCRKENLAHDGCWQHDFRALYDDLAPAAGFSIHPSLIDNQCVYFVAKPGATLPGAVVGSSEPRISGQLSRELDEERARRAGLEESVRELEEEKRRLEDEVAALKSATPYRLSEQARRLPLFGLARSLARSATAMLPAAPAQTRREEEGESDEVDLPFAGVATRASLSSVEAFIAARPEVVSLCHPEWRGIRAATLGQNPYVLEVPGIVSDEHCTRLVRFLEDCGTRLLVINGYPPGMEKLCQLLRQMSSQVRVQFVYHGNASLTHFREDRAIEQMLQMVDHEWVDRLGFVKGGFAEFFRGLGYPADHLMNVLRALHQPVRLEPGDDGKLHVGVFAPNVCHKNLDTQLLGALMVPGTVVHTSERPENAYLQRADRRIVHHGILPQPEFLSLLSRMNAALYVSLVECYPMTVLEALAAGVVCVTSHTSIQFNDDAELFRSLVVTEHDNPQAIARRLMDALQRRAELVPRAQAHILKLNARAERLWQEFTQP